jgi:hypothetical protein
VPLPNGCQVELVHLLFEVPCEVTFTFVKHPVVFEPTLEGIGLAVYGWWVNDILPLLGTDLYFVRYRATDVSSAGGASVEVDLPDPPRGGIGGGCLTANVAVRVNYKVAAPPGRRIGCCFLPGIPREIVFGNYITQAWADAVNDVFSNLIDAAEHESWRWVVWSKFLNGALRSTAVGYRVDFPRIDGLTVGQRRRRLHNELPP